MIRKRSSCGLALRMRRNNKDWTAAGADKVPPIITRGVLIDLAGEKQLDVLSDSYEITPTDLKRALAAQKLSLHAGDAVFIRTGRMTVMARSGSVRAARTRYRSGRRRVAGRAGCDPTISPWRVSRSAGNRYALTCSPKLASTEWKWSGWKNSPATACLNLL